MQDEQLRKVIHETVEKTLQGIGFNTKSPNDIQADLLYLQKLRRGSEEMSRLVKKSTITVLIPAFMYVIWEVIKHTLSR